jgi:hypothetical protein
VRRGGEVHITLPQMGDEAFPEKDLRPTLRIHDAADRGAILQVDVGPDWAEGNALAFDERAVIGGCGKDRIMAALRELACQAEIGVNIPERTEAGDDDALAHAWSRGASVGPAADRRVPPSRLVYFAVRRREHLPCPCPRRLASAEFQHIPGASGHGTVNCICDCDPLTALTRARR